MNLLVSTSPISPTDKARIKTLVQPCLTAQGQAVAATEAEIDAIVTPYRAKIETGDLRLKTIVLIPDFFSSEIQ